MWFRNLIVLSSFLFCRHLSSVSFFFFFHFLCQIASNNLWHPRRSVLEYLQVMIFANLFAITSNPQFVLDVKDLVLSLLADEQLEVSVLLRTNQNATTDGNEPNSHRRCFSHCRPVCCCCSYLLLSFSLNLSFLITFSSPSGSRDGGCNIQWPGSLRLLWAWWRTAGTRLTLALLKLVLVLLESSA